MALALAAGVWVAADVRSKGRLEATRAGLRALGVAPTYAEFLAGRELVPPEADAARWLAPAAGAIDADSWPAEMFAPAAPPPTDAQARQLVEANAAALAALDGVDATLRPAVERVRADFGVEFGTPGEDAMISVPLPHLNEQRSLVRLLLLAARNATARDDPDAALTHLRRALGVADAVDAADFVPVTHRAALGIDLDVAEAASEASHGDLDLAAATELAGLLRDDGPRRDGWRRAIAGEITFHMDIADYLAAGRDPETNEFSWRQRLAAPLTRDNGPAAAGLFMPALDVAGAATFAEVEPVLRRVEAEADAMRNTRSLRTIFVRLLAPSVRPMAERHFNARAARHAAAGALEAGAADSAQRDRRAGALQGSPAQVPAPHMPR